MMNRKPVYHDKFDLRIVSRPNSLWAVQHNTRNPEKDPKSNQKDYWRDFHGASKLSLDQAKARMSAEAALLKGNVA